jgi:hypothetical protein
MFWTNRSYGGYRHGYTNSRGGSCYYSSGSRGLSNFQSRYQKKYYVYNKPNC